MATYLIDYENVKSEGIKGIAQLSEEDRVVIFYSHNADTITFEAMDMIFNSKAQVSKYKILCGGKNALDFQLSTYLGYLIHEAKDSYFYIISKDNGFKHVVDFWKRTFRFDGYVYCFATIADGNARQNRFKNATAKERARAMEEELAAMSEELEAQDDSDLEESEEDSAPETKEVVKEVVNEAETVNVKENSEAEEMMQEEEPEAEAEQEVEEAPAEEEVQKEHTEEEPVQETESVQEEPAKELVQEESPEEPVQEEPAKELVQEKSAEKEPTEEPVQEPEQPKENKELENFASETIIYPVQQHKPISVMPPAQLPESVRKELEKADAQYKDSSDEDLQKKIAVAVSASTITVVESGMTIHHVEEETKTKPVKKKAPAKTKKAPKQEEASENEVKPKKTRTAKTPKNKTEKEALAAEEKPAKPARKPITRSTRAKKEAVPAEEKPVQEKLAKEKPAKEKPVKEKTAKEKPVKEKSVQEKPAEEAAEPKKPARRGRRPKAQSNIAASFE